MFSMIGVPRMRKCRSRSAKLLISHDCHGAVAEISAVLPRSDRVMEDPEPGVESRMPKVDDLPLGLGSCPDYEHELILADVRAGIGEDEDPVSAFSNYI
jgi:hypothetical protein